MSIRKRELSEGNSGRLATENRPHLSGEPYDLAPENHHRSPDGTENRGERKQLIGTDVSHDLSPMMNFDEAWAALPLCRDRSNLRFVSGTSPGRIRDFANQMQVEPLPIPYTTIAICCVSATVSA